MVAQYQQFLDGVRTHAGLSETEQARQATVHVIEAMARHLDGVDRQQLATGIPQGLRSSVRWDIENASAHSLEEFLQEVAQRTDSTPERSRYLVQGVLSALTEQDRALADTLQHRLPDGFSALFTAPGGGPPPDWGAASADDRPRPLDADELQRALNQLVGWSGDTERISREVTLPPERWTPIYRQVEAAQQELSHHAAVEERSDGVVVFSLHTRSLGAVTELDLQLARRIDAAISEVGSGGANRAP
ncbi:pterin-4a-carbinolamine dehydratase [Halopolyspora algeriensis]|uniref:Putative pterin-4-alpha-carbinolamine dehydratase n=1 Tax=Halopolyspora algeriensis TaxID=1500506 RepID=A0A368VY44_9ACTN|nr:DUF2267 domain-containing protein [Halopolyspora algeriensis]RCW46237.1 pterin-4a-carbinolamine dehydratase [Halopolyspora algeriensis]TQM55640.1 pterin-4a-carbinolamine dehydratase [Halopolyspora algeriensis]